MIRIVQSHKWNRMVATIHLQQFVIAIDSLFTCDASIIFTGDFNFPNIDWSIRDLMSVENSHCSYSSIFCDFIQRHSLLQYVTSPTRNNNTLDLVFCNDHFAIFDLSVTAPFNSSDHNAVTFNVLSGKSSVANANVQMKYNFQKADWPSIHVSLDNIDWQNLFLNHPIETIWDCFHDVLIKIIDDNVPKFGSSPNVKPHYPKHILKLQSRKHIIWKKWQSSKQESDKLRYLCISKECRAAIFEYTLSKERALVDSNNLGRFYKYVNRKLSSKSGIGVLKNDQNELIYDSAGQASILNKYFSSAFPHDDGTNPLFPTRISDDIGLSSIPFSADDVYKKLVELKPNSAAGPDNHSPLFLKQVAKEIAHPLACIGRLLMLSILIFQKRLILLSTRNYLLNYPVMV